jgi:ABC-type phosphate transport system substrate-binding protein
VGLPARAQPAPSPSFYRVVVNPKNPLLSVDREFVAQSFLKKVTTWGHGGVIRPVDLALDSPVRRKFSEEVLRRSVSAVRSYWLQIVFAGRGVPPPELGSDDEVVRYVLREPGAIGYVSNRADVRGARVLVVQER